MIWETKRHEDEIENLKRKLKGIEEESGSVKSEKDRHDTKLKEMEKVVNQLLSVNDALVAQITGKTESFKANAKKISKKKASAIKSSKSSKSSDTVVKKSVKQVPVKTSSKIIKYDAQKIMAHANATSDKNSLASAKIDELQHLHKIYSKLTNSIEEKDETNSGSDEGRPTIKRIVPKKSAATETKESSVKGQTKVSKTTVHHIPSAKSSSVQREEHFEYHERPEVFRKYQSSSNTSDDLKDVISSLEEEFDVLNKQYHKLLSTVNDGSNSVETVQADELVNVIQKLHRKGEQLRHLKSPSKV